MSHIVKCSTEVKDDKALGAACLRLKLAAPEKGEFNVRGRKIKGLQVKLDSYRNFVFGEDGEAVFDADYRTQLDTIVQAYGVEAAKAQLQEQGYSVEEELITVGEKAGTIQLVGTSWA